jgi:hypothetical protein
MWTWRDAPSCMPYCQCEKKRAGLDIGAKVHVYFRRAERSCPVSRAPSRLGIVSDRVHTDAPRVKVWSPKEVAFEIVSTRRRRDLFFSLGHRVHSDACLALALPKRAVSPGALALSLSLSRPLSTVPS